MRKLLLSIALCCVLGATALPPSSGIRFHDEANDTTRISSMLTEASAIDFRTPEDRVEFFARKFIGKPYVAHTLENGTGPESLTVNIDELDCTTFVETALALAYTVGERRMSWRDYVYNLERIRYRNGELNGYPSRLHYICDWAVDNIHRGNITDATTVFPRYSYLVRSVDFMTVNRDRYPSLADSASYARMREVENGYRNHRFPYIKTADLGSKDVKAAFHSGDVVAFVSKLKNLDVTHMGIVVRDDNGMLHALHASMTNGHVEISKLPFDEFVKKNRNWIGVRVFRLSE